MLAFCDYVNIMMQVCCLVMPIDMIAVLLLLWWNWGSLRTYLSTDFICLSCFLQLNHTSMRWQQPVNFSLLRLSESCDAG